MVNIADTDQTCYILWCLRVIVVYTFFAEIRKSLVFLESNKQNNKSYLESSRYTIYPKYWETLSAYHTCSKIQNSSFYYRMMLCCMYGILLYVWQTVQTLIRCHILWQLIWVYFVCNGLSVLILRVITVTRFAHLYKFVQHRTSSSFIG